MERPIKGDFIILNGKYNELGREGTGFETNRIKLVIFK